MHALKRRIIDDAKLSVCLANPGTRPPTQDEVMEFVDGLARQQFGQTVGNLRQCDRFALLNDVARELRAEQQLVLRTWG